MQIRELILHNFGKFHNRSFQLTEGINIVYGENEFGKSTLHSFIKGMLFGVERNSKKKVKQGTAMGKYEPWEGTTEYSGTMKFQSGDKKYSLSRDFNKQEKKTALICEDTGETLNVFRGDLDLLLGKIDGINYENTVSIAQRKVETTEELTAELTNYAANYHSRGSNDIQIEEVQQYLRSKKQGIENIRSEKKLQLVSKKEKLNLEYDYIKRELERLEELLKSNQKLETAQRAKQEKRNSSLDIPVLPCIGVLVLTVPVMAIVHRPWNVLTVIIMILSLGLYLWNKLKYKPIGKNLKKELTKELEKLSWENKRLLREIQEKEVVLENISEQIKSVSEIDLWNEDSLKKIASIELAMTRVEEVSHSIQKDFGLLLNENASKILKDITKNKYSKLEISEKLEVSIFCEDRILGIDQVSRGTIEQVYFALRMSIAMLLHTEELPILLDDTFAYFDEDRLLEVLKWLHKNKKQVIIFTCHKREEDLLKEAGISYHMVK